MSISPKSYSRTLCNRVRKRITPILWMLNSDALDLIIREVATMYIEENLRDNEYKTRNFLIETKNEIKTINQWTQKSSEKK